MKTIYEERGTKIYIQNDVREYFLNLEIPDGHRGHKISISFSAEQTESIVRQISSELTKLNLRLAKTLLLDLCNAPGIDPEILQMALTDIREED